MKRYDIQLGLVLMLLAIVCVIALSVYYLIPGDRIPIAILAVPSLLFALGGLLTAFDVIETGLGVDDEIAALPHLLQDDVEALRQGRITGPHMLAAALICMVCAETYLLIHFDKWEAQWGSFNVLLLGLIVAVIGAVLLIKTRWFQYRPIRTPGWIIATPLIAFVICALLGVYYAEPGKRARGENYSGSDYRWTDTRGSRTGIADTWLYSDTGDTLSWIGMPDCDGDECGYLVLGLVILLVAIICVIGSALIPHFWIVATLLLLAIVMVQTARELIFSPHKLKEDAMHDEPGDSVA